MTDTQPASPLPWVFDETNVGYADGAYYGIHGEWQGRDIFRVRCKDGVGKQDAEYIVIACNAYPALSTLPAKLTELAEKWESESVESVTDSCTHPDDLRALVKGLEGAEKETTDADVR